MEGNQQLHRSVASGIRTWSGLGCSVRVHKYNSRLHGGRAVKKTMQCKEGWGKVRRMKQEMGEGIVKRGGGEAEVE